MESTAVLTPARPAGGAALRHVPRRSATATSVLRAVGTGSIPVLSGADAAGSTRVPASGHGVRALRLRDLAGSGAAAAGSWTIAAHLGLLGTAAGTFMVSVVSAILVALTADSLTGLRRMLLRSVSRLRQNRRHRRRH